MIKHRDVYETSYRTNYTQAFSPRDEKPWRHFEPINAGPPTKLYSRRSNVSSNKSEGSKSHRNLEALGGSLPGVFETQQVTASYGGGDQISGVEAGGSYRDLSGRNPLPELRKGRIAEKAAAIEEAIQADLRLQEMKNDQMSSMAMSIGDPRRNRNKRVVWLYQNRASADCAVVLLVARWLRLNIHYIDINLNSTSSVAELTRVSPLGQELPVIIDGDVQGGEGSTFTLSHARSIIKYLVSKYASKDQLESLYPTESGRRGRIDALIDYEHTTIWPLVTSYINIILPRPFDNDFYTYNQSTKSVDNLSISQITAQLNDVFRVLSETLTVRRFFGSTASSSSNEVSLADVLIARDLSFLYTCGYFIRNQSTPGSQGLPGNLAGWLERMMELPNWHESMEAVNGAILTQL